MQAEDEPDSHARPHAPHAAILQGWTMFHNVTAVTNMPRYPEQLDNLKRWRAARQDTMCACCGGGR